MSEHDAVLRRFAQAEGLVERLVDALPKATIAEVARLLAMNVAHYKRLHGDIPLAEDATLTEAGQAVLMAAARGELSPQQAQQLLGALASQARITEVDELTRRVEALEQQHGTA